MFTAGCLAVLLSSLGIGQPVPVANGGFEQGLDGWSLLKPKDHASGEVTIVKDDAFAGQQAARITNPAEGDKVLTGLLSAKPLALPDGRRTFSLSVRMKALVAPQMIELRIAALGRDGQPLVPWNEHGWRFYRPPVEPLLGNWYNVTTSFGARDDWGGIQLTIWVNGAGADVLVDEVTITGVDPADWLTPQTGSRLPDPAPGIALWWEGPLRKVYPFEQPPTDRDQPLVLTAARGETEIAQLVLRPLQDLPRAVATATDLTGPATLPASAVQLNWVGLIPVTLALDGHTILGPTPDPLLRETQHDLPASQASSLWITVKVPAGQPAGIYRGEIRVATGKLQAVLPLQVRVCDVVLPAQPRLRTIARIWQQHKGYEDQFLQDLVAHRCSGTSYLGGIKLKRDGDRLDVDVSGLHDAIESRLKQYGLRVFNIPAIFLGDASGFYAKDHKWQGYEILSPEFDQAFSQYCGTVGDALRKEGVLDLALWQIWDEPQNAEMMEVCRHLANLVLTAVPEAKVYLTTGVKPDLVELVGIWDLPWPSRYRADEVALARQHGAEIWAYQNTLYALDSGDSSLQMRAYLWRLRKYGIQGVEWWSISDWKSDPWTTPNQHPRQNGGGFFLYPTPDRTGPPIDSIRWEQYREGVEDYDLLTLFAETYDRVRGDRKTGDVGAGQMLELVDLIAKDTADNTRDPRRFAAVHQELLGRLELLTADPPVIVTTRSDAQGRVVAVSGAGAQVDGKPVGDGFERRLKLGESLTVTAGPRSATVTGLAPLE